LAVGELAHEHVGVQD